MEERNRLCLDLGNRTGWALRVGVARYSGVWDLSERSGEGAGMRFVRFTRYLGELMKLGPIHEAYYEDVRNFMVPRGPGRGVTESAPFAMNYGGFKAHFTAWCEQNAIPYAGVPVGTIKRHATGRGTANKPTMLAACHARLGVQPQDDNEIDALWLLDYEEALARGEALPPKAPRGRKRKRRVVPMEVTACPQS